MFLICAGRTSICCFTHYTPATLSLYIFSNCAGRSSNVYTDVHSKELKIG